MRIRHTYLTAILAAAFAALATTLAAAPPAAADCVDSGGVTLCSQGEVTGSSGAPVAATPYVPLPCDLDWLCDMGESIALSS